jgi:hypothetical protein
MKKLFTLITFVLLTTFIAQAQDGWITYKADNHISIKFPKQPAELIPGTMGAVGVDSVGYGITVIDLNKMANVDSATVATIKESPEFADQLRMGIEQGAGNLQLQPFKMGTWQGLTSYTSSGIDADHKQFKMLMVIYGTKIYNFFTIVPQKAKAEAGEAFLNSATFTK